MSTVFGATIIVLMIFGAVTAESKSEHADMVKGCQITMRHLYKRADVKVIDEASLLTFCKKEMIE